MQVSVDKFCNQVREVFLAKEDVVVRFPFTNEIGTAKTNAAKAPLMRPTADTALNVMGIRLRRVDNVVQRKVGLLVCNHSYKDVIDTNGYPVGKVFEARHKTSLMERFLRNSLGFDSVKTIVDVDLSEVHGALNEIQRTEIDPWMANENRSGTILVFVYYMGYWAGTSGSQVFSVKGEQINLDQRLIAMSALDRSIYTVQWVEMGLECDLNETAEDQFECEKAVYHKGAHRWFTLFYNSATNKFIEYFERLI